MFGGTHVSFSGRVRALARPLISKIGEALNGSAFALNGHGSSPRTRDITVLALKGSGFSRADFGRAAFEGDLFVGMKGTGFSPYINGRCA